jgi:hypothetical protein
MDIYLWTMFHRWPSFHFPFKISPILLWHDGVLPISYSLDFCSEYSLYSNEDKENLSILPLLTYFSW